MSEALLGGPRLQSLFRDEGRSGTFHFAALVTVFRETRCAQKKAKAAKDGQGNEGHEQDRHSNHLLAV